MLKPLVPVESFFDPTLMASVWPKSITSNEIFLRQIKGRSELISQLNSILDCLPRPDISIESAINQGYISEQQTTNLYLSLAKLLSDLDYRRLVLYLPFEFLPNKTWQPGGEKLQQILNQFKHAYMEAWKSLLYAYDVRANFVDGDIIEEEQYNDRLPRVVKAAHLVPKLVEKGLLEVKDVIELMEKSDDPTLKDSIADALFVLADLGFITEKEIKKRKKRIKSEPKSITEKRKTWLEKKEKQKAIEVSAKGISAAITENRLTNEHTGDKRVLTEGIRIAIESAALTDLAKAQTLYARYQNVLLSLFNDPSTNEVILKTFRRLRQLGIVEEKQLTELNIVIPKLAGPFSENLKLMGKEMSDIQKMVASIETNPKLSQLIYPVALVFGSRLNGYGDQSADIDLAVFVRQETSFSNRLKLQELLRKTFAHEKIRSNEIIEFWLEEKEGKLLVRDRAEADLSLGERYWTHILFGAAWLGNEVAISELYKKMLVPFMYDTSKIIEGREACALYLEDIEQSAIQYRLMHKGYERFFPPYGGIHTKHTDDIDGASMFWDSGFRQLATKLFVSRVFLPKIPAI
jgi:hypothetical protein